MPAAHHLLADTEAAIARHTLLQVASLPDRIDALPQPAQQGDAPVLIRVETQAGHGAGKPTSKIIAEQADKYAFFFHNVGVTPAFGAR